jgi:hypothetical protein
LGVIVVRTEESVRRDNEGTWARATREWLRILRESIWYRIISLIISSGLVVTAATRPPVEAWKAAAVSCGALAAGPLVVGIAVLLWWALTAPYKQRTEARRQRNNAETLLRAGERLSASALRDHLDQQVDEGRSLISTVPADPAGRYDHLEKIRTWDAVNNHVIGQSLLNKAWNEHYAAITLQVHQVPDATEETLRKLVKPRLAALEGFREDVAEAQ